MMQMGIYCLKRLHRSFPTFLPSGGKLEQLTPSQLCFSLAHSTIVLAKMTLNPVGEVGMRTCTRGYADMCICTSRLSTVWMHCLILLPVFNDMFITPMHPLSFSRSYFLSIPSFQSFFKSIIERGWQRAALWGLFPCGSPGRGSRRLAPLFDDLQERVCRISPSHLLWSRHSWSSMWHK